MHLTDLLRSSAAITDSPGVFFQEELLRALSRRKLFVMRLGESGVALYASVKLKRHSGRTRR
jgi:hypothetical protein